MITKGAAKRRSCRWSPGAMKAHTCQRMMGMARMTPATMEIFMLVQKDSVGVRATSWTPALSRGRRR